MPAHGSANQGAAQLAIGTSPFGFRQTSFRRLGMVRGRREVCVEEVATRDAVAGAHGFPPPEAQVRR